MPVQMEFAKSLWEESPKIEQKNTKTKENLGPRMQQEESNSTIKNAKMADGPNPLLSKEPHL